MELLILSDGCLHCILNAYKISNDIFFMTLLVVILKMLLIHVMDWRHCDDRRSLLIQNLIGNKIVISHKKNTTKTHIILCIYLYPSVNIEWIINLSNVLLVDFLKIFYLLFTIFWYIQSVLVIGWEWIIKNRI